MVHAIVVQGQAVEQRVAALLPLTAPLGGPAATKSSGEDVSSSASAGGATKSVASPPFSNWTASTHTAPPGGPVRDELSRVVAETTIGTSLAAALNNVAARVGTNEANAVFSTLAQSLEMGTSVAENHQRAAQLIRHSARVKAQTQAQKAVVNMSFPLLLLILPGIFIVLFAPLVIQFINR